MTTLHWFPDTRGDILAAAVRPGAAAPAVVHVRPEVYARIGPRPLVLAPTAAGWADTPTAIPLVVDDQLPRSPGYEVHRVAPRQPGAVVRELRLREDGDRRAARGPVSDPGRLLGGSRQAS
jgi:hypothetical protein